jgi:hypothetical protein
VAEGALRLFTVEAESTERAPEFGRRVHAANGDRDLARVDASAVRRLSVRLCENDCPTVNGERTD